MSGRLITFEGLDGAGKSTQLALAAATLERMGVAYTVTRQPGGTPAGLAMRQALLDPATQMDARQEILVYAADRVLHCTQVVEPALSAGLWVLCDRWADSTMAYQGFGRQQPLQWIKTVNQFATRGHEPDVTFFLDIEPDEAMRRMATKKTRDRIEQEDLEFWQRVRDGYLRLAHWDPVRWARLDGSAAPSLIAEQVGQRLRQLQQ